MTDSRRPNLRSRDSAPSEEESAAEAVRPFVDLTPEQRLRAQAELVRSLVSFAGDRPLLRDDDLDPLWPRWKDPLLGGRAD